MATPQINALPGQQEAEVMAEVMDDNKGGMVVIPMGLLSLVDPEVAEEVQLMAVSMHRITYIAKILMMFVALKLCKQIEDAKTYDEKLALVKKFPDLPYHFRKGIEWSSTCGNRGPGVLRERHAEQKYDDEDTLMNNMLQHAYHNDLSQELREEAEATSRDGCSHLINSQCDN